MHRSVVILGAELRTTPGWIKIECRGWREAKKDRWETFEKR